MFMLPSESIEDEIYRATWNLYIKSIVDTLGKHKQSTTIKKLNDFDIILLLKVGKSHK